MKMLTERLETKVKADSLSINPWKGSVTLFGFYLEDKSNYPMLKIDTLHAGISLLHLIHKEVRLNAVNLSGADITLYKAHSDSAANYQFAIDAFKSKKKKVKTDWEEAEKKKFQFGVDVDDINIRRLHIKWDVCDKQRKYIGKPHRGHFDANHINAEIDIQASAKSIRKDSFNIHINDASITDYASGLKIKHLNTKAMMGKNYFSVPEMNIGLENTSIKVADVKAQYETIPGDKKSGKKAKVNMTFEPFPVTADVILKDIAAPFGPALSHFTTPLTLSTLVSGTLDNIIFDNIVITTPDKRLILTAEGTMQGLTLGKEGLAIRFRHIDMKARKNVKDEIIMHFAKKVRLKMVRQIHAVGDIGFMGSLDILYKRQIFDGVLLTNSGNINTRFTLNSNTHFMSGYLSTTGFELGNIMNVSGLGPINSNANFKFNISKKAKRPATALPNGRLPMGSLQATINDVKFNFMRFKKLDAMIESDGSTAFGAIHIPQLMLDIVVDFDYIQTDEQQKLKVYPTMERHVPLNDITSMLKRRQLRARQKEEREAAKAQRKLLKEEKQVLKEKQKMLNEQLKKEMDKFKETLRQFKKKREKSR